MRMESPLIAVMLGLLFFTGFYAVFLSVGDEYGVDYNESTVETNNGTSISDAFGRINSTKNQMDQITEEFDNTTVTEQNSIFPFLSITFKMGQLILNSLTTYKDLMFISIQILGIPTAFVVTLFAILTVVFVLMIAFILLGRTQ